MASFNVTRVIMALVALFVAGILISGGDNAVAGQGCQGDLQGLITRCGMYVRKEGPKMDPSQECCNVVKGVDVPCVCKYITKEIERMIDMEKVAHVAQVCGKPLAHGTKCGSYTVPSEMD